MKKTIFLLSILFFPALIFSQNFQGIAYYVSQTSMKNFSISSPDMTPEMNEKMNEEISKNVLKTGTLTLNKMETEELASIELVMSYVDKHTEKLDKLRADLKAQYPNLLSDSQHND
jgi:hypothetical protein